MTATGKNQAMKNAVATFKAQSVRREMGTATRILNVKVPSNVEKTIAHGAMEMTVVIIHIRGGHHLHLRVWTVSGVGGPLPQAVLEGATRAVVGATTQGPEESSEVLGMEGGDVLVQVLKEYAATHNHVQVGKVVIC